MLLVFSLIGMIGSAWLMKNVIYMIANKVREFFQSANVNMAEDETAEENDSETRHGTTANDPVSEKKRCPSAQKVRRTGGSCSTTPSSKKKGKLSGEKSNANFGPRVCP